MSVTDIGLTERIKEFMENEARSGSMDFGCVMPMYVYRMWGGKFSMEDIENGLREIRNEGELRDDRVVRNAKNNIDNQIE